MNAQERGFINLSIQTDFLIISASSGGIIKVSGTTKDQVVEVDLYGVYHGFNLSSSVSSLVKSGTGAKAEIKAGETLDASVGFGGTIFYKGFPEVVKSKKIIGGMIEARN